MTIFTKNETLVKPIFGKLAQTSKWKCMRKTTREKGQGWSSVLSHINTKHSSYMNQALLGKELSYLRTDIKLASKTVWINS